MATLGNKSDQEIRELLDEYGIKHGPIVNTTRALYEKKLREAMAKNNVMSAGPSGDGKPYMRSRPEYSERDFVDEPHVYNTPSSSSYSKPTPVVKSGGGVVEEEKTESSGRLIPLWIQFLVFLIVAGFLYFIFINMESAESSPFNRIQ
ncbi:unnamed protein product [Coregonus sp. 'balchen']|nr:unnamed protein product [Coregonus sp. 'balchen']